MRGGGGEGVGLEERQSCMAKGEQETMPSFLATPTPLLKERCREALWLKREKGDSSLRVLRWRCEGAMAPVRVSLPSNSSLTSRLPLTGGGGSTSISQAPSSAIVHLTGHIIMQQHANKRVKYNITD